MIHSDETLAYLKRRYTSCLALADEATLAPAVQRMFHFDAAVFLDILQDFEEENQEAYEVHAKAHGQMV